MDWIVKRMRVTGGRYYEDYYVKYKSFPEVPWGQAGAVWGDRKKAMRYPTKTKAMQDHFYWKAMDGSHYELEKWEENPMKIERAIRLLMKQYEADKHNKIIRDPVAHALYVTWKMADTERDKSVPIYDFEMNEVE